MASLGFHFFTVVLFSGTAVTAVLASGLSCHRSGNFVPSVFDHSLPVTILATELVDSSLECAIKCVERSLCLSYNYERAPSTPTHKCELLEGTKDDTAPLVTRSGYTHYERQKETCEECKNEAACTYSCIDDQKTLCKCTPSYKGVSCEEPALTEVEIPPEEQGIIEHSKAIVNCYSSTADTLTWYKDDVKLDTTSSHVNLLRNGSLEFLDFTSSDNGLYYCNISNFHDSSASKPVALGVLEPPGFIWGPRSTTIIGAGVYIGLRYKLTPFCTLDAWYKDGVEIDFSTSNGRLENHVLIFSKPAVSDSGMYKIKISNVLGTVFSAEVEFIVLARCPFASPPTNGWRQGIHTQGATMEFHCKFKYTMVGSATLTCQADGTWDNAFPTCVADTSNNHPLRLSGSTNDNEGRVEIYSGGKWGAIGHDGWDQNAADVVCRQFGFPWALRAYNYSKFGASTGSIYMNDVDCSGTESRLEECTASYDTEQTSGNMTAGVMCQNIRLGGGGSHQGLLEMFNGGRWGTVCDDLWSAMNTHVACTQLGFGSGRSFSSGVAQGSGDIVLDEVACLGRELNLLHCSHLTTNNCSHSEDVSLDCDVVRLAGTPTYRQGRVEVYQGGAWGTVCDDLWYGEETEVVCRELGFPGAVRHNDAAMYGPGTGSIYYDESACAGTEERYSSCPKSSDNDCSHGEDIGVICQAHVRLAGSTNYYEGRVESLKDGAWGTVCDASWDINDAHVVCRMLGFDGAVSAYDAAHFGEGTGSVHWDGLQCDGAESRIEYCPLSPSGTCSHANDAGVRCQVLRLNGSPWANQGRVELYFNDMWGTICDAEFLAGDAALICAQIGRSAYHHYASHPGRYGQGTGLIHMNDLACIRTEDSIFECAYTNTTSGCTHANDVSVRCNFGTKIDVDTSVVDGPIRSYRDKAWGRVCANDWDIRDAEVACREMSYPLGALDAYSVPRDPQYVVRRAGMACEGYETALSECKQGVVDTSSCTADAAVTCQDLRLVGGPTYYEGRLEMYKPIAIWGTICGTSWDERDATVACMQLGFKAGANTSYVAGTTLAVVGANPSTNRAYWCRGDETTLHDCSTSQKLAGCTPEKDVWVKCNP